MLISSKNTLTNLLRIMFSQISGHTVCDPVKFAHKLIITPWVASLPSRQQIPWWVKLYFMGKAVLYKIKLSMAWKWIKKRKTGNRNKIKSIIIAHVMIRGRSSLTNMNKILFSTILCWVIKVQAYSCHPAV